LPSGREKGHEIGVPALAVEESLVVPPEASIAAPAQRFVRTVLANSDVGKDVAGHAVLLTKALINNAILPRRNAVGERVGSPGRG
jgi:hypothetical protein